LIRRGIEVEIHVFGCGPLLADMRSEAWTGRFGQVVFEGFVEDTDRIFQNIDLLIVPSLTESSPRAVLEAMDRQVAVVACAVGDIPTILDHGRCGIIAGTHSVSDLVEGCERLIRDADSRARVTQRAKQRWEEYYRLELMAQRVQNLYLRVLGTEV
jgi:glycosyltransferase involved in cell wall biosynthesis